MGCYRETFRDARKVLLPSGRLFCCYRQIVSFCHSRPGGLGLPLPSRRSGLAREVLLSSDSFFWFCHSRPGGLGLTLPSRRSRLAHEVLLLSDSLMVVYYDFSDNNECAVFIK